MGVVLSKFLLWVIGVRFYWGILGVSGEYAVQDCFYGGVRELRYFYVNFYLILVEGCFQEGVNFLAFLVCRKSREGYYCGSWIFILVGYFVRLKRIWILI